MGDLHVDNISAAHLESLYAFFVHGRSADEAADILAGRAPPVVAGADDDEEGEGVGATSAAKGVHSGDGDRLSLAQRAARARATATAAARLALKRAASLADLSRLRRSSTCMHGLTEAAAEAATRRNLVLSELLAWCKTSAELTIPVLRWSEVAEEDEEAEEQHREGRSSHAFCHSSSGSGHHGKEGAARSDAEAIADAAAAARGAVFSHEIPAMRARALRELGFLIAAYRIECWYWEVTELIRKLLLTSILALIAPLSAGQVVAGLLIAFFALILNLHMRPFAEGALNTVNTLVRVWRAARVGCHSGCSLTAASPPRARQQAQLNLFFFLLVALLLKVNLDDSGDSRFYVGIVGALSIFPLSMPMVVTLYMRSRRTGLEGRMLAKDAEWE